MQERPYSLDRARAFIASVTWVFAKTQARYNPHHYIVENVEGGPEFDAFAALVRSSPIRRWHGGRYFCLSVDEHDYWLTYVHPRLRIINRKPTVSAGWDPEPPPTRDRAELVWHDFEHRLLDEERRDTLLADLERGL